MDALSSAMPLSSAPSDGSRPAASISTSRSIRPDARRIARKPWMHRPTKRANDAERAPPIT
jgi:hypothetical protein